MHGSCEYRKSVARLAAGAMLLMTAMSVTAAAADGPDQWEYDAMIYLWAPGIDATTETGDDIDISLDDIINDLDIAFMGTLGARKGKWSLALDTIYLDISQDEGGSGSRPVLGATLKVDIDVGLKASISTFGGGYNLIDNDRATLDLIGGARYGWVDTDLKVKSDRTDPRLQLSRDIKVSDSQDNWDGIVGVRGELNLNDHWYMPYYADVGTGQSDLTWQALAGVGYKFKWGDVLLVYRHLDYEFDSGDLLEDLTVSGPALGARFYF
jgi:hypothetical protein